MNTESSRETYGLSFLEVPEVTRAVARLEYGSHGTLAPNIPIAVKTYNFEPNILPGRVETIAAVKIYIGSKRIFSENYSTKDGYRTSTDKLLFSPTDI